MSGDVNFPTTLEGCWELYGSTVRGYNERVEKLEAENAELVARNKHLSTFLEEAAHAAACGKSPAKYLATEIPTALRDEIAALRAELAAKEAECQKLADDGLREYERAEVARAELESVNGLSNAMIEEQAKSPGASGILIRSLMEELKIRTAELEAANKRADGARAEVRDMQESVETYRSRYNAENVRAIQAEGERDREAKAAREARAVALDVFTYYVNKSRVYTYVDEWEPVFSLARSESKGGE